MYTGNTPLPASGSWNRPGLQDRPAIPELAPSTPSVSPSCQRTSSWQDVSVENALKLFQTTYKNKRPFSRPRRCEFSMVMCYLGRYITDNLIFSVLSTWPPKVMLTLQFFFMKLLCSVPELCPPWADYSSGPPYKSMVMCYLGTPITA